MRDLLLYSIRQFGLVITLVTLARWTIWWLAVGRKHQQDWQIAQSMFDFVSQERVVNFDGKHVIHTQLPPLPSPAFYNMFTPKEERHADKLATVLYPSFANIAVTGQCCFHCWHCSAANRADYQGDLPFETWQQIIRQLQNVGVYYLGITGGEPLLRDDLEDIIHTADERSVLALGTSGRGLTPERARRLRDAGLFYILISLDHHRREVHDRFRGLEGAYETAIQAMHYAKEARLYVILQAAITRKFVAEDAVWSLAELGREVGLQEIRCRGIVPSGRLVNIDRAELLTERDRQSFMRSANQINSRPDYPKVSLFEEFEHPTRFGCNAGGMHIYVDCSGNLCPCDFAPLSFGNLCEETFQDVWSRIRDALGSPQTMCLACFAADYIADRDLKFPLPLEISREICQHYRTPELPGIFSQSGSHQSSTTGAKAYDISRTC